MTSMNILYAKTLSVRHQSSQFCTFKPLTRPKSLGLLVTVTVPRLRARALPMRAGLYFHGKLPAHGTGCVGTGSFTQSRAQPFSVGL